MDGMTRSLTDYADDVWNGAADDNIAQSGSGESGVLDVADGVGFHPGFGNVITFRAGGELVLFDSGNPMGAPALHSAIRQWSPDPVSTVVFSHGHIDHVFGVGPFDAEDTHSEEQQRAGWQVRDWREVAGQLPRILAALLFSRIWVPLGNTGRARVSAFQPMPLSAELKRLLE